MVLPYYNGAAPDDCGVSAFVFLPGGHITLHTFSFRECFFADVLAPDGFDTTAAQQLFAMNLPAAEVKAESLPRSEPCFAPKVDAGRDFGPHMSVEVQGYTGPRSMDELFALFDCLPEQIDMTPIMRPYIMRSKLPDGSAVTSAMTMLAESHAALHLFEAENRAYVDVFSCTFFDIEGVLEALKRSFPGQRHTAQLLVRGENYRERWTAREQVQNRGRVWLASRA